MYRIIIRRPVPDIPGNHPGNVPGVGSQQFLNVNIYTISNTTPAKIRYYFAGIYSTLFPGTPPGWLFIRGRCRLPDFGLGRQFFQSSCPGCAPRRWGSS